MTLLTPSLLTRALSNFTFCGASVLVRFFWVAMSSGMLGVLNCGPVASIYAGRTPTVWTENMPWLCEFLQH